MAFGFAIFRYSSWSILTDCPSEPQRSPLRQLQVWKQEHLMYSLSKGRLLHSMRTEPCVRFCLGWDAVVCSVFLSIVCKIRQKPAGLHLPTATEQLDLASHDWKIHSLGCAILYDTLDTMSIYNSIKSDLAFHFIRIFCCGFKLVSFAGRPQREASKTLLDWLSGQSSQTIIA